MRRSPPSCRGISGNFFLFCPNLPILDSFSFCFKSTSFFV
ncbi:hypothetical protein Pint_35467 [Pistacia integerrima]|uniref:Uncharacterized protein n=1 Tax=Pistacia integerrima TaxID=434235 RepID=A0ACC0Y161_9ROSI|nr:hypothetical protein Pint_35467 [Pistacia integerrima]